MSEENLETNSADEGQEAPQEAVIENENENVETPAVVEGEEITPEVTPEEETVTKTKKELDDEFAKARRIAERRGRAGAEREIQERLQQELAKVQEQPVQQPQPQNVNTYLDEGLQRNLPGNMTIDEYARLTGAQPTGQPAQPQAPVQQVQQPVQQPVQQQERFSSAADDQAIECDEDFVDFIKVLKDGMPSTTMINAVSQDESGLKNLYLKLKEEPTFALQVSRLSPQDQQHRMWQLNQEMATKKAKKVVSKATPQPAAVKAGGNIHVNEDKIPMSELRELRKSQAEARRRKG